MWTFLRILLLFSSEFIQIDESVIFSLFFFYSFVFYSFGDPMSCDDIYVKRQMYIYNIFKFSLSIIDTFNDIIRHDNRQQRPIIFLSLYMFTSMFINVYKTIDARLKFICPIGGSSIILSIFETNKQKTKHNNSEDKTSTRLRMTNRVTRIFIRIHSNTHPNTQTRIQRSRTYINDTIKC